MLSILFVAVLLMQFVPYFMKNEELRRMFTWPIIVCCGAMAVIYFVGGSIFMAALWAFFCGFEYHQAQG